MTGNPISNLGLELPHEADRNNLAPLYSKIYEKYKANDSLANMWFEPVPQPDSMPLFGGMTVSVGFTEPPGADIGSPNHVLNDHSYCCAMDPGACANMEPMMDEKSAKSCAKFHKNKLAKRAEDAERLGVPLFISEFGACFSDGPCTQEIGMLADEADANLVGWAYWQFKIYEDLTTSAGTHSEGVYNADGTL